MKTIVPMMVSAAMTLSISVMAYAENNVLPNLDRQTELIYLLKHDCGSCHGMRLLGGLGPALTPEALKARPSEYIATTILEGRVGTPMPPWKRFISQDEADWLAIKLKKGVME